jgi:hypothetical protein
MASSQRLPSALRGYRRPERRALSLAAGFFLAWIWVLYPGADHPPPGGFVWLVVLALVASVLVCLRSPTYAGWHAARRPHRVLRVLRDGAVTGLAFGTLTLVLSAARPGSAVALGREPVLTWLVVLTLVGAMNATLLSVLIALGRGQASRNWGRGVGRRFR